MRGQQSVTLVGAVLAGGRSSRMGALGDKAALSIPVEGEPSRTETLGERAVRALRELGCVDVVILGHGRGLDAHLERIDDVADAPDAGPAAALLALMRSERAVEDGAYVVIPVDMPGVDTALLRSLVDVVVPSSLHALPASLGAVPAESDGVRASLRAMRADNDGLQRSSAARFVDGPLPCVLSASSAARAQLEAAFARGERKLSSLIDVVGAQTIACAHPELLENINTQADLQRWSRRFTGE